MDDEITVRVPDHVVKFELNRVLSVVDDQTGHWSILYFSQKVPVAFNRNNIYGTRFLICWSAVVNWASGVCVSKIRRLITPVFFFFYVFNREYFKRIIPSWLWMNTRSPKQICHRLRSTNLGEKIAKTRTRLGLIRRPSDRNLFFRFCPTRWPM